MFVTERFSTFKLGSTSSKTKVSNTVNAELNKVTGVRFMNSSSTSEYPQAMVLMIVWGAMLSSILLYGAVLFVVLQHRGLERS